jgi:hypothetical protein
MYTLFICMFRGYKGDIQFAVSDWKQKHQAIAGWKQSGFDVIDIIDVELSVGAGHSPQAIIRALASTPDGAETLSSMLRAVADHQRSWKDPLLVPPIHEEWR